MLVSQTGCPDASHAEHASAFHRREAACLARAFVESGQCGDRGRNDDRINRRNATV